MFDGLYKNKMFLFVSLVTFGLQIFLVEVGGDFVKTSSLNVSQWLITIALGFLGIIIGIAMRFFPIAEDPNSFFILPGSLIDVGKKENKESIKKANMEILTYKYDEENSKKNGEIVSEKMMKQSPNGSDSHSSTKTSNNNNYSAIDVNSLLTDGLSLSLKIKAGSPKGGSPKQSVSKISIGN